ncbi:MAG: hypothetical protein VX730_08840 [Pseudomonadota bacterium]|nr:hypothetical protein [Pseudomonadota bacterium]
MGCKNIKKEKLSPEGWECRSVVNKSSGQVIYSYFFKRKRVPHKYIKTQIAKRAVGYTLLKKDIKNIKYWANLSQAMHEENGHDFSQNFQRSSEIYTDLNLNLKAILVATVTFYGKLFTTADGRKVKLEKKMFSGEMLDTHNRLMGFRNHFAAHSGDEGIEWARLAFAISKKKGSFSAPYIGTELFQPSSVHFEDKHFELFDFIEKHIDTKREQVMQKVLDAELDKIGLTLIK